jgi:hypothetical protein
MAINNHIFNSIKHITKPIIDKKGFYLLKLIEDWDNILPNPLCTQVIPYKLMWIENTATLYLKLISSELAPLIQFENAKILNNINNYFNFNCIIAIKYVK